jgi:predicted nucleic acid-binding protein
VHLRRVEQVPDPSPELVASWSSLDLQRGEREAFQVMQEYPGATFLTDDGVARLLARLLGYEVHGTLGMILQAIDRGLRSRRQVLNPLRKLPERSSLHLKPELLEAAIASVRGRPP